MNRIYRFFFLVILFSSAISRIILGHAKPFWLLMAESPVFLKKFLVVILVLAALVPWFEKLLQAATGLTDRIKIRQNISLSPAAENMIMLVAGTLLFTILIVIGKSLFSGYHFRDDYTILVQAMRLKETGFFTCVYEAVKGDLSIRFRPLYIFNVVLKAYIFGPSYGTLMMIDMVEGVLTFWILCKAIRFLGEGPVFSLLISGVIIFGKQFQPWFRFLNQENEGMLLCALVFLMISYGCGTEKGRELWCKWWYQGLLLVIMLLSSLQKESFLILIPAWMLLALSLQFMQNQPVRIPEIVKKNVWFLLSSCGILLFGIYMILTHSGTTSIGYAQVSSETTLLQYAIGFSKCWHGDAWPVNRLMLTGAALLVLIFFYGNRDLLLTQFKKWTGVLLFASAILFVQLVLYSHSGMQERYVLPYALGAGVVVFVLRQMIRQNSFLHMAFIVAVVFTVSIGIVHSFDMTRSYYEEGMDARRLLESLKQETDKRTEARILVDSYAEDAVAMNVWFDYYADPEHTAAIEWVQFQDGYGVRLEGVLDETTIDTFDIIVTHPWPAESMEEWYWIKEHGLRLDDYNVIRPSGQWGSVLLVKRED